jgi:hypothetical protein
MYDLMMSLASEQVWGAARSAGGYAAMALFIFTLLNQLPDQASKRRWLALFIGCALGVAILAWSPLTTWYVQSLIYLLTLVVVAVVFEHVRVLSVLADRLFYWSSKVSLLTGIQLTIILALVLLPLVYLLQ